MVPFFSCKWEKREGFLPSTGGYGHHRRETHIYTQYQQEQSRAHKWWILFLSVKPMDSWTLPLIPANALVRWKEERYRGKQGNKGFFLCMGYRRTLATPLRDRSGSAAGIKPLISLQSWPKSQKLVFWSPLSFLTTKGREVHPAGSLSFLSLSLILSLFLSLSQSGFNFAPASEIP